MILIVLKIQIRPDRRDVWLERIAKYTAAVRDEPGNLTFDVYESIDAPNEFSIVEGFASKEAGDAHVQTEHFKDFLVWFPTVIGTAPQIINTQVDGWNRMSEFDN
ncbi:MAG TPA: putative quinol monooxygenase [Acidimicrobiia bacterium]|nr:putative quinol monooxygenase [Acidimicrobiia bacterium]HZQ79569.1 putative quinol monooxygenase [Acidimicrobiia bacterium]